MSLPSASLIQHLQDLEQQIADAPRYREALRASFDRRDRSALTDAKRHLRAMAVTTGHIKAQVIPADNLGVVLESLSELVLRAVRMVVLTELTALHDVVTESSALARTLAWFPERFRAADAYLRDELQRITGPWDQYRGMQDVERAAYRAALGVAHASMRELGTTSVAARFLREGVNRTDWPALSAGCSRILAVLTLRIDIDPDLPLLVHSHPLHGPALNLTLAKAGTP